MPYKDPEKNRKARAACYQKTKERIKAYGAEYYKRNKEKMLAAHKKWVAENKQKLSANRAKHYQKNKKKYNARGKVWREKNKERLTITKHARMRTIKYRFDYAKNTAKTRKIPFRLTIEEYAQTVASGLCHYCNGPLPECGTGLDRINQESIYAIGEIVPCCARCNMTFMHNFQYKEKLILAEAIKTVDRERVRKRLCNGCNYQNLYAFSILPVSLSA